MPSNEKDTVGRFNALADFVENLRDASGDEALELIGALQSAQYRIPEPEDIRSVGSRHGKGVEVAVVAEGEYQPSRGSCLETIHTCEWVENVDPMSFEPGTKLYAFPVDPM